MTDKFLEKINGYKNSVLGSIAVGIFIAGMTLGGYIGLPSKVIMLEREVSILERDISAVVCMLVTMQENRDSGACYLLMSENTRIFVQEARSGNLDFPAPRR